MLLTKIRSNKIPRSQIRFIEWYTRDVSFTKVQSYDTRRALRTHTISFYRMVYARRVAHKSTGAELRWPPLNPRTIPFSRMISCVITCMRIQCKFDISAPQGRKLKYTVIHCKGILAPIGQKYPSMVGGGGSLLVPAWERQNGRWPAWETCPMISMFCHSVKSRTKLPD